MIQQEPRGPHAPSVHRNGANGQDDARLAELRRALVDGLRRAGIITDPRVAAAFDAVPRHLFLPAVTPERAYSDAAIMTKEQGGVWISSSSQPAMMAIMLQQLELEPGLRILEIGAGTGYNAALMRQLVGPSGRVVAIDIDEDIVAGARARLAALGLDDVEVIQRDGAAGWPPEAPYDRVILTVGAADVLPAWVEQLRTGGLLVLPLRLRPHFGQYSIALRKGPDGELVGESLAPCGFMPLRGAFPGDEGTTEVAVGGWRVVVEQRPEIDPAQIPALLERPLGEESLPIDLSADGLWTYLTFAGEPFADLTQAATEAGAPPRRLFGPLDTSVMSACLCVVPMRGGPEESPPPPIALLYGSLAAYDRLLAHHAAWEAAGRPRLDGVRVLVRPHAAAGAPPPPAGALAIVKRWSTLILADRGGRPFPAPSMAR